MKAARRVERAVGQLGHVYMLSKSEFKLFSEGMRDTNWENDISWATSNPGDFRREKLTSTNHFNNSNIALILPMLVMTRMKKIYNNRLVKFFCKYWHINVILFLYLFRISIRLFVLILFYVNIYINFLDALKIILDKKI